MIYLRNLTVTECLKYSVPIVYGEKGLVRVLGDECISIEFSPRLKSSGLSEAVKCFIMSERLHGGW